MTNFLWKRRRNTTRKNLDSRHATLDTELMIPTHFRCPISLGLMKDPVSLSTGITYDRENIERWIDSGHATCPVTNQPLKILDRTPNHAIHMMIQEWCVENRWSGVERVPTPRFPISPWEVSDICATMLMAAKTGDEQKCWELVAKIKYSARESERNRHYVSRNEFGSALADVFEAFARLSIEKHSDLLREILSVLAWAFPHEEEKSVLKVGSVAGLCCLIWFLGDDNLSSRRDAVLVLNEIVSVDKKCVEALTNIDGAERALFRALNLPICPLATQACLVIIHQMLLLQPQKGQATTLGLVRMELVPLLLDIIVEGNKGICEKALGVLDVICNSGEGKERAGSNALTVPLVVKKILRVSDLGTELSISIFWKLVVGGDTCCLREALELGAFEKLLLVLQIGCGEGTKVKVTELLKMMNKYRDKLDCFDSSMGFKQMKRV